MSFSLNVKSELCRITNSNKCCLLNETAAVFIIGGIVDNNGCMLISTENAAFTARLFKNIKVLTDFLPELKHRREKNLRKHMLYSVSIPQNIASTIKNKAENKKNCCRKAWLRGAFLVAGSMVHPEKGYHLEIICRTYEIAEKVADRMQGFSLNAGIVERNSSYIVYLKESENIVDFLNITGAHKSLISLENIRIMKGMRNNVNRIVNCETANLDRTTDASQKQRLDIEQIVQKKGLESLPGKLREIAELRLKHPEASLSELGLMLDPVLGKSGVYHRLRKIQKIAESGNYD